MRILKLSTEPRLRDGRLRMRGFRGRSNVPPQGPPATPSSQRGDRQPQVASDEDQQHRTERRQAIVAIQIEFQAAEQAGTQAAEQAGTSLRARRENHIYKILNVLC